MGTSRELVVATARRKGAAAAMAGVATAAMTAVAISLGSPVLAVAVLTGGGVWTTRRALDWLKYRGTWGLRF